MQTFKVRFSGSIMEWVVSGSRYFDEPKVGFSLLFVTGFRRNHVKKVKCAKLEFMSSFGVEFELRGGVFMPFISRPCLDWGREKKINCQKSFNFFFSLRRSISAL